MNVFKLLKTGTVIVTVGVFVGSVFSYLLQFALGKLLSIPEFGEFNALVSLATIFALPAGALTTSMIKLVADLKAKNDFSLLTNLYVKFTGIALTLGILIFFLILLAQDFVASYLNLTSGDVLFPFSIFIGLSFIGLIPTAYLQGLLRYKGFAFFMIMNGLLRFIFPILFIFLGFGLPGIFFGFSLELVICFLLAIVLLKKNFITYETAELTEHYKKFLRFGFSALLVWIGMTLLNNIDVILVKHYFDAHTAGIYAGSVTVGKIFLFGAGVFSVAMFPQVAALHAKGENPTKKFMQFLFIHLVLVLGGILVFSLFPELITRLLFGEKFLPAVVYLPRFSVFVGLYILLNFMTTFFLAISVTKIFLFQIPLVIIQYVLITLYHTSLNNVININILITALLLAALGAYYAHIYYRTRL